MRESIEKIGNLANVNTPKEPTRNQIEQFLNINGVSKIIPQKVNVFEKKFKMKTSGALQYLSSIDKTTKVKILGNLDFEILNSNDWELWKDSKKLIKFAEDKFGNYLCFDPKEKHYAVYYFDHETMIYDLIFENIYELKNYSQ